MLAKCHYNIVRVNVSTQTQDTDTGIEGMLIVRGFVGVLAGGGRGMKKAWLRVKHGLLQWEHGVFTIGPVESRDGWVARWGRTGRQTGVWVQQEGKWQAGRWAWEGQGYKYRKTTKQFQNSEYTILNDPDVGSTTLAEATIWWWIDAKPGYICSWVDWNQVWDNQEALENEGSTTPKAPRHTHLWSGRHRQGCRRDMGKG